MTILLWVLLGFFGVTVAAGWMLVFGLCAGTTIAGYVAAYTVGAGGVSAWIKKQLTKRTTYKLKKGK